MDISKDYKMLLEAIAGLMVIDKSGNLVYMNEQCADYIKRDRKKSLGKYITDVFPPSVMQNMLKGDKKFDTNFYFENGRMSVSSQVQLRHGNEVVGVLEYDTVQNIGDMDDLLDKYAKSLQTEVAYYRKQMRTFQNTKYSIDNILGSSKKIQELKREIEIAASSNSTVLIEGETGTGKELVAHSIHNLSRRGFHNFVKVNAAGMPESLIESELFGYEEGAFTGAKSSGKQGKFTLADKGTLFIDEIEQMPLFVQPKLLRALQEGEVSPVGSEKDIIVDVRVIASSNKNLEEMVYNDEFRDDLYYRLNVFPIRVPPLRERMEDIPELVEAKVKNLNGELGKNINKIDPKVYDILCEYQWPGNVRELNNRVEAAVNYTQDNVLRAEHFNVRIDNSNIDLEKLQKVQNPIEEIKREAERKLINEVLMRFDYNKTKTARYLKISRSLLYQKMKRLGIKN